MIKPTLQCLQLHKCFGFSIAHCKNNRLIVKNFYLYIFLKKAFSYFYSTFKNNNSKYRYYRNSRSITSYYTIDKRIFSLNSKQYQNTTHPLLENVISIYGSPCSLALSSSIPMWKGLFGEVTLSSLLWFQLINCNATT